MSDQPEPSPPPTASTADYVPAEGPGSRIGPYKLLQQIGIGGMGIVYMAEQEQPVRRRVALKVIKPGMDSAHVINRFRAEQQALALMDHQNIAKVYDAGVTAAGLPFFVMELVHGVPITKYCDDNKLTPRERLELFIPVCRAVQHAHQKGIIHRDLKPSNVLVCLYDGKPVAKVIDFGVAKAMEQPLTEQTMFTQFGQIVGTLEYMSPEQAEMSQLGIDTRSDIYSLGVMLYELLTGSTPLQRQRIKTAAFDEVLRLIREEEPPVPSSRLSSSTDALPKISQQRRTEPAQLTRLVRGELDWIVMKSLEKDRTRRYDSAGGLAQDIERYLTDEPVEACPPSATYRLRKYAHKHRVLLSTMAAFALILIIGTSVSIWQAIRATNAESDAEVAKTAAIKDRDDAKKASADLTLASEKLRRVLYAADMNLVSVAWAGRQPQQALDILERHKPQPGETDLRGFEWHYWQRRLNTDTKRVQLEGFGDRYYNRRDFSTNTMPILGPDGTRCAHAAFLADGDIDVRVWNTSTGKVTASQKIAALAKDWKAANPIVLAFSPDAKYLVMLRIGASNSSLTNYASVWTMLDLEAGKSYPFQNALLLRFHPDGKHFIAWSDSPRALVLREVATGVEVKKLAADLLSQPVFSSSADRVAVIQSEKGSHHVLVLDTATGAAIGKINLPKIFNPLGSIPELDLSPDGKKLALGPVTSSIKKDAKIENWPGTNSLTCWDVSSGKHLWTHSPSPSWQIGGLQFAPDGKRLLLNPVTNFFSDGTPAGLFVPRLVETETGFTESMLRGAEPFASLSHHTMYDAMLYRNSFSPDGELVVSYNELDKKLLVSSCSNGRVVLNCMFPFELLRTRFTPDGKQLMAIDQLGLIRFWNLAPTRRLAKLVPGNPDVSMDLVDDDAKHLVMMRRTKPETPMSASMLHLYDLPNRKELRKRGPFSGRAHVFQFDHARWVTLYQGESQDLLQDQSPAKCWVIDLKSGREFELWKGPKREKIDPTANITPPPRPRVEFHPTRDLAILAKGDELLFTINILASGGTFAPSRLTLFDLAKGAPKESWINDLKDIQACKFTPDGKSVLLLRIAAVNNDDGAREALLADLETGTVHWRIPNVGFAAYELLISPNGRNVLLTGGNLQGQVAQLFELSTGKPGKRLQMNIGGAGHFFFQFTPDGKRILANEQGKNGAIGTRIWETDEGLNLGLLSGHAAGAVYRLAKNGQNLWTLRTHWEAMPPGDALDTIDATPWPGNRP